MMKVPQYTSDYWKKYKFCNKFYGNYNAKIRNALLYTRFFFAGNIQQYLLNFNEHWFLISKILFVAEEEEEKSPPGNF